MNCTYISTNYIIYLYESISCTVFRGVHITYLQHTIHTFRGFVKTPVFNQGTSETNVLGKIFGLSDVSVALSI